MNKKAGVPLLWPIYRENIHWGNSRTSDPKRPGKAHKSSVRATAFWSLVCYGATVVVCFIYRYNLIDRLGDITNNFK